MPKFCDESILASSGGRACGRPAKYILSFPSGDRTMCESHTHQMLAIASVPVIVRRVERPN